MRVIAVKYTDEDRGTIQNRERAKQIINFSGIRYGNITPTDVDCFFEKENKIFVFYEYKLAGVKMPRGQELALMRVVDGLNQAGKTAVLFLCRHEEYDANKDIVGARAIVEKLYWNGSWYNGRGYTVKDQTDRYIKWAETLEGRSE